MLKVGDKNITSEQCHCRLSNVFIVDFEYVSLFVLVFLLLTLNKYLFAGGDIILEISYTVVNKHEVFIGKILELIVTGCYFYNQII